MASAASTKVRVVSLEGSEIKGSLAVDAGGPTTTMKMAGMSWENGVVLEDIARRAPRKRGPGGCVLPGGYVVRTR